MVFAFSKFSEIRARWVSSQLLSLPLVRLVPSVTHHLCLSWEWASSSSFFREGPRFQKCFEWKPTLSPEVLLSLFLCHDNSPPSTCLTTHLLVWVGEQHQRCVFTAVALNRHNKVFCFVSKGSADGESSCFQLSLTLVASFCYVLLPQKVICSIFKSSSNTKICEPPHLLYSGL